jgi:hypothetical protein
LAEIRVEGEVVTAEETAELELLFVAEIPRVICGDESRVRLIFLPRIDGVADIREKAVRLILGKNWDEAGIRAPKVPETKLMSANVRQGGRFVAR